MTATSDARIDPGVLDARPVATTLLERLANRLAPGTRIETVYGSPVTAGDVTVIPVARGEWAFGGGAGPGGEGTGGGAGARVRPVGYIEMSDGKTWFRPVVDPVQLLFGVTLAALAAGLLFRRPGRRKVRLVLRTRSGGLVAFTR